MKGFGVRGASTRAALAWLILIGVSGSLLGCGARGAGGRGGVAAAESVEAGSIGAIATRQAAPAKPRTEAPGGSDLSVAEALQNAFNAAASAALPVVVEVNVVEVVRQNLTGSISPFDFFFGQAPDGQEGEYRREGLGSGVIIGRDGRTGYVLTNHHVAGSAAEIQVRLHDGREFPGKLVGSDARMDLALVSFTTDEELPVAVLGDSDALRVGDWVIAVGNPYGFESTVTAGIVSALGRRAESGTGIADLTDYIQTDASINSGNSGGALVNLRGEVIGINTWIASQTGGSVGIGFAIPINNAKAAVGDLIQSGRILYGWLGVSIGDAGPQTLPGVADDLRLQGRRGSLVFNVYRGGPADRAGVLPGDFIIGAGGGTVGSTQELSQAVARAKPGSDLALTLVRQGAERTLTVRLEARPQEDRLSQPSVLWPGLTVMRLTDQIRDQLGASARNLKGLFIGGVDESGVAAAAGLRGGEVILEMNGGRLESVAEFYRILNDPKGREITLKVNRQGLERTVTLRR